MLFDALGFLLEGTADSFLFVGFLYRALLHFPSVISLSRLKSPSVPDCSVILFPTFLPGKPFLSFLRLSFLTLGLYVLMKYLYLGWRELF